MFEEETPKAIRLVEYGLFFRGSVKISYGVVLQPYVLKMKCDCDFPLSFVHPASKNMAGKSREELALEKQLELERRLMDVSGQLNSGKKPPKTKRKPSAPLFGIQTSRIRI